MFWEILKYPELVKILMSVVAGSLVALFTIYLLIKLLEKVVMKKSYRKKADEDLDEIKCFLQELMEENKDDR